MALISHGSDLRHPDEHRDLFRDSYFDHADDSWVQIMQKTVERNQKTLRKFPEVPLFVSTPDLLLHQPRASWLPLTVDERLFAIGATPIFRRPKPTVLHIPSRRNPPIKGTHIIDPILRRLNDCGLIEYISPEGVTHAEMIRLIARSDVVVDQILTGSYGLTAVEAMAMGRLVIGNLSDRVRATLPGVVPIIDAPPHNFERVLMELIEDPVHFAHVASQGVNFARDWHDGREAAIAIYRWLNPKGHS